MKLYFYLHFATGPDAYMVLTGTCESLGNGIEENGRRMLPDGDHIWRLEADIPDRQLREGEILYHYTLFKNGRPLMREAGPQRVLRLAGQTRSATWRDQWQGNTEDAVFLTRPFTQIYYPQTDFGLPAQTPTSGTLVIQATLPNLSPKHGRPYLVGNIPQMGSWQPEKAIAMTPAGGCRWQARIPAQWKQATPIEYKFILRKGEQTTWETGENRQCLVPSLAPDQELCLDHAATNLPFPRPRLAGTAIPIFALRREKGWGIGDFTDLKPLIVWARQTGQHVIQLLPINDTTTRWTAADTYPYSAISVMALHPIYGNPDAVAPLPGWEKERHRLNQSPTVDYPAVLALKWKCWSALEQQLGEKVRSTEAYRRFLEQHRHWLLPYAAFCTLRDHFHTADFSKWGTYASYHNDLPLTLLASDSAFRGTMLLHMTVQFWLDQQLSEAVALAHQHKIALKGDLPIGITANSVEAWTEPELFHCDMQAGAPPDAFAQEGQNWGFPTYHWEAMAKDRYRWWKKRFVRMADHFDMYRIDHILGFFRIWEIPRPHRQGTLGHFSPALPYSAEELAQASFPLKAEHLNGQLWVEDPRQPDKVHPFIQAHTSESYRQLTPAEKSRYDRLYHEFFYQRNDACWEASALEKLPELIASTDLLPCAEDLGMIPNCVPDVLNRLRIATLEVQRMPKQPGRSLANPAEYPYRCVCTTGTHDTSTLRGWWKETHPRAQDCPVSTCRKIIREHLDSPAMWIILPWQDWMSLFADLRHPVAEEERINQPANPSHIWNYRMHISLERLLQEKKNNQTLQRFLKNCIL